MKVVRLMYRSAAREPTMSLHLLVYGVYQQVYTVY
jgi:hypothetical protein